MANKSNLWLHLSAASPVHSGEDLAKQETHVVLAYQSRFMVGCDIEDIFVNSSIESDKNEGTKAK